MYCTNCGTPRADNAAACANCGQPVPHFPVQPRIESYLVPAVLTTICCCPPGGIVAIVYAAQVNSKLAAGDIEGARKASRDAKMWSWISAGAGLAIAIGYAVVMAVIMIGAK